MSTFSLFSLCFVYDWLATLELLWFLNPNYTCGVPSLTGEGSESSELSLFSNLEGSKIGIARLKMGYLFLSTYLTDILFITSSFILFLPLAFNVSTMASARISTTFKKIAKRKKEA